MKIRILTLIISSSLLLGGCATVKKAYTKILKPCTVSDLTGDLLFLGAANTLGPGDVFRKQPEGGFGLSYRLFRIVPLEKERTDMIDAQNTEASCNGSSELNSKLSAKVSAKDLPGNPTASATLATASSITTRVDGFQWYTLEQTEFEKKIDALKTSDPNSVYIKTLKEKKTYVITRALKVTGMTVTYHFTSDVDAGAQAQVKVSMPVLMANGQVTRLLS